MPDPLASQIRSPLQLRAELVAMVCRDFLGPANGPDEELTERVRDRCSAGLVAPRGHDHAVRGVMLVSSANLTEYAMTLNMEPGILFCGGPLPRQVDAHLGRLIEMGIFRPL
jgi:hypothetical protein